MMPKCFILTSLTACQHMADPSMVLNPDIQVLNTKSNRREESLQESEGLQKAGIKECKSIYSLLYTLKVKSVSKFIVDVLFPFSYKENNCFRKSSLSDCLLHFCSCAERHGWFCFLIFLPFLSSKRKGKLLPSAISIKKIIYKLQQVQAVYS